MAEKKAVKIEFGKEELDEIKSVLRKHLNALETKPLEALCKKHGINPSNYKHLSGGLYKMNLVNSLVGAGARGLRDGSIKKGIIKKSF